MYCTSLQQTSNMCTHVSTSPSSFCTLFYELANGLQNMLCHNTIHFHIVYRSSIDFVVFVYHKYHNIAIFYYYFLCRSTAAPFPTHLHRQDPLQLATISSPGQDRSVCDFLLPYPCTTILIDASLGHGQLVRLAPNTYVSSRVKLELPQCRRPILSDRPDPKYTMHADHHFWPPVCTI